MKLVLDIVQIVLGVLLIIVVLLQSKGAGLGSAFGGGDSIATTRRGAEKGLFQLTIVFSILFVGIAAARMFLS